MKTRMASATLFALYQLSLLTGILLMPIAVLARQVGITLPIHRIIERAHAAYDSA